MHAIPDLLIATEWSTAICYCKQFPSVLSSRARRAATIPQVSHAVVVRFTNQQALRRCITSRVPACRWSRCFRRGRVAWAAAGVGHRGALQRQGETLHRPVSARRTASAFDLGSQTQRAGRDSRRLQSDSDQRPGHAHLRTASGNSEADGQDRAAASRHHRRSCAFVQRLCNAHRSAAPAVESREREPRPTQ